VKIKTIVKVERLFINPNATVRYASMLRGA
jgi:hypothetical protein